MQRGDVIYTINVNSCHRISWGVLANVRDGEIDVDGAPVGEVLVAPSDIWLHRTPPGYRSTHRTGDYFRTLNDAKAALARRLRAEALEVERTI
jgi:hypothetical protein